MKSQPYLRYACTVVKDGNAPDGYKIVENDPHVATLPFLHGMSAHMTRPQSVRGSVKVGDDVFETMTSAHQGETGHFEAAIRTIPNAFLSSVGRS